MVAQSLLGPFRRIDLFAALSPFQISEIARRTERIMFRDGDVIAEAGGEADAAILIIDGDVACTHGIPLQLGVGQLEPGTLLAEMAMFTEFEHAATFVARGPVKALRITRAAMLEQMLEDPSVAECLVGEVAGRLKKMAGELRMIDSGFEQALSEVTTQPGLSSAIKNDRSASSATSTVHAESIDSMIV